jgi:hypothetical protein
LPESLTWLLVKGKIERARDIITTILRVNRLPPLDNLDKTLKPFRDGFSAPPEVVDANTPEKEDGGMALGSKITMVCQQSSPITETPPTSVLDLFKTPTIRRYSIFMFYL